MSAIQQNQKLRQELVSSPGIVWSWISTAVCDICLRKVCHYFFPIHITKITWGGIVHCSYHCMIFTGFSNHQCHMGKKTLETIEVKFFLLLQTEHWQHHQLFMQAELMLLLDITQFKFKKLRSALLELLGLVYNFVRSDTKKSEL